MLTKTWKVLIVESRVRTGTGAYRTVTILPQRELRVPAATAVDARSLAVRQYLEGVGAFGRSPEAHAAVSNAVTIDLEPVAMYDDGLLECGHSAKGAVARTNPDCLTCRLARNAANRGLRCGWCGMDLASEMLKGAGEPATDTHGLKVCEFCTDKYLSDADEYERDRETEED